MISELKNINYNKYVENTFSHRYIHPVKLQDFLIENYGHYINKIGYSTLGIPIFKLTIGTGKNKILAWTQMHGNESTSTLAFLDFLKLYHQNSEFASTFNQKYQLDLILMLNPDGSTKWQRENALGLDINRDFKQSKSPEMSVLKKTLFEEDYQLVLNCHDQRTVFGNLENGNPATLSILAPSIDDENSINNARSRAIKILANLFANLGKEIKPFVTRFDDTYYPTASGDNIQKMNIPTILLESGFYKNDYERKKAREFFFQAFLLILQIVDYEVLENDYLYYEIPKNSDIYRDILIRNINVISNSYMSPIDVSLQYKEVLNDETKTIDYVPIIKEIGDLSHLKGWKEYNLSSNTFNYEANVFSLGNEAYNLLNHLSINI